MDPESEQTAPLGLLAFFNFIDKHKFIGYRIGWFYYCFSPHHQLEDSILEIQHIQSENVKSNACKNRRGHTVT